MADGIPSARVGNYSRFMCNGAALSSDGSESHTCVYDGYIYTQASVCVSVVVGPSALCELLDWPAFEWE